MCRNAVCLPKKLSLDLSGTLWSTGPLLRQAKTGQKSQPLTLQIHAYVTGSNVQNVPICLCAYPPNCEWIYPGQSRTPVHRHRRAHTNNMNVSKTINVCRNAVCLPKKLWLDLSRTLWSTGPLLSQAKRDQKSQPLTLQISFFITVPQHLGHISTSPPTPKLTHEMYLNPLRPPQPSEYVSKPTQAPSRRHHQPSLSALIIRQGDTQALIHARSLAEVRSTKDRASIIIIALVSPFDNHVSDENILDNNIYWHHVYN